MAEEDNQMNSDDERREDVFEERRKRRLRVKSINENPYPLLNACISFLVKLGVVQMPGMLMPSVPLTVIRNIVEDYQESSESARGDQNFFQERESNPEEVAGVLWFHLRTLQEPLFPFDVYERIFQLVSSKAPTDIHPDSEEFVSRVGTRLGMTEMEEVLMSVPVKRRMCLNKLFYFLQLIESQGRSSLTIATICSPLLCRARSTSFLSIRHRHEALLCRLLIKALLENYHKLGSSFSSLDDPPAGPRIDNSLPEKADSRKSQLASESKKRENNVPKLELRSAIERKKTEEIPLSTLSSQSISIGLGVVSNASIDDGCENGSNGAAIMTPPRTSKTFSSINPEMNKIKRSDMEAFNRLLQSTTRQVHSVSEIDPKKNWWDILTRCIIRQEDLDGPETGKDCICCEHSYETSRTFKPETISTYQLDSPTLFCRDPSQSPGTPESSSPLLKNGSRPATAHTGRVLMGLHPNGLTKSNSEANLSRFDSANVKKIPASSAQAGKLEPRIEDGPEKRLQSRHQHSQSQLQIVNRGFASREELENEKRALKKRLKLFDSDFEAKHGRRPRRSEKEPIRHLYEAYNGIKAMLQAHDKVGTIGPWNNNNMNKSDGAVLENDDLSTRGLLKPAQVEPQHLRAGVEPLLLEKRALQNKLRKFEKDFEERNSRKVKYTRDIKGLENEYRRYKELKNQLAILGVQTGGRKRPSTAST